MRTLTHYTLVNLFSLVLIGLIGVGGQPARADHSADQSMGPRELVMTVSNTLVDQLRAQHEEIKQDKTIAYRLANEIVVPHVDFPRIGRWVLGKYWRQASEDQRQAFLKSFKRHLMQTYATSMVNYTDEILSQADQVTYLPLRDSLDSDQVTVRSRIKLPRGSDAQVDYTMIKTDNGWKIADVTVDGISLALTYRKDFTAQISRNGLDSLIAKLKDRDTAPLDL